MRSIVATDGVLNVQENFVLLKYTNRTVILKFRNYKGPFDILKTFK